jgi:hypothetical protein
MRNKYYIVNVPPWEKVYYIVNLPIKGEHLLYSKISGRMIGYGWGNVCYIVNFPLGEYLLYSKVSGGKVYYIANIPRGLLCGRCTIRHPLFVCLVMLITV